MARDGCIGDPHLAAVDHPLITLQHRRRAGSPRIRPGVRLGQAKGGHMLTLSRWLEESLLLLIIPKHGNGRTT